MPSGRRTRTSAPSHSRTRRGSPPRTEKRATCSGPSTLSRRKLEGRSRRRRYAEMGVSRSASSSRETGTTLGAPARAARRPGRRPRTARHGSTSTAPFGSAGAIGPAAGGRPSAGGGARRRPVGLETKKAGLAGTVPLTSALTVPALATSGDRYAGPGPSWAQGRHQRHAHQRCPSGRRGSCTPGRIVPSTLGAPGHACQEGGPARPRMAAPWPSVDGPGFGVPTPAS